MQDMAKRDRHQLQVIGKTQAVCSGQRSQKGVVFRPMLVGSDRGTHRRTIVPAASRVCTVSNILMGMRKIDVAAINAARRGAPPA
jgi:hypothetical protein